MKKLTVLTLALLSASVAGAQLRIGGRSINVAKVVQAASDATTAITLTDEDVAQLCRESVEWMDANNPIAGPDTEYGARLARLTAGMTEVNGLPLNFKVYHVIDINAFASGDGSIRVFSSLMDIMDDDELVAIIGHEVGHIANHDVKDAIRTAYLAAAARGAISSTGGKVAALTDSQLGDLAMALTDSQFSQAQEFAADDYGYKVCVENGFSPYGMANSLQKLVDLSTGEKASALQKMFSSHPDSAKRSARMREAADKAAQSKE
jgi:putative metalloprotease